MENKNVKFIRINGRVVPVKIKKNGSGDRRHISNKILAMESSKLKPNKQKIDGLAKAGFFTGLAHGILTSKTLPSTLFRASALAVTGAVIGSVRTTNKQEVIDKMIKRRKSRDKK